MRVLQKLLCGAIPSPGAQQTSREALVIKFSINYFHFVHVKPRLRYISYRNVSVFDGCQSNRYHDNFSHRMILAG